MTTRSSAQISHPSSGKDSMCHTHDSARSLYPSRPTTGRPVQIPIPSSHALFRHHPAERIQLTITHLRELFLCRDAWELPTHPPRFNKREPSPASNSPCLSCSLRSPNKYIPSCSIAARTRVDHALCEWKGEIVLPRGT